MSTCIRVLIWADLLAMYAIWVMMTYLTDVWKLSLTHAAGIINIWGGIALTLPVGFVYIVDTFSGHFSMLAFSSVAYSIGLGLLSMSTPPVLHKSTGTCSAYEPECIGRTQKALFYTSLALLATGIAGRIVSLKPFLDYQKDPPEEPIVQDPPKQPNVSGGNRKTRRNIPIRKMKKREMFFALFTVIGGIALPYIKPWSIKFGIPAICTLVAIIVFLVGYGYGKYKREEVEGSPITHLVRVIVASAARSAEQLPNPSDLVKEEGKGKLLHTNGLRCLDKAAVKSTVYGENRWRVCTVTEVEETKIAIRMLPMWITFIMCGVVLSASNTYFQEQAKNLDTKLGKIKVPVPILLVAQQLGKIVFGEIYKSMRFKKGIRAPPLGISVAMIFSTLCCITAAKIEARRLDVIESHGLADKPDETVPMTIFLLLPQFLLLSGLEAFFSSSVPDLFHDQSPTSMAKYFDHFTRGISGLGYLVSVLAVYVVGNISERGGRKNWFQYTLNQSRLDNYYWTLAAISAVNLVIYVLMATCYPYKQPPSDEIEPDEEQGNNDRVLEAVNGSLIVPS